MVRQELNLSEERLKQKLSREHSIAVEALKMRKEFHETTRRQQEIETRARQEEQDKISRGRKYAAEVKQQIHDMEQNRRKAREDSFIEGFRYTKSLAEKKAKLDAVKERKLAELRELGVPEKYCVEIKRKMKEAEKNKISNQPFIPQSAHARSVKGVS